MSELFPAKSIAIEVVSCTDPSKIRLFNRWFDQQYLEALRATPGIVDVYRYLDLEPDLGDLAVGRFAPSPGSPTRNVTLYRIDSDDPWTVMQQVQKDNERRRAGKELPEYLESYETTVWDFVAVRQSAQEPVRPATKSPDGMPEVILLVFSGADPTKQMEHNDWWLYAHSRDLLETPGMTQCERYRNLDPDRGDDDALFLNIYEFDTDDPEGALRKILDDDEKVRKPQGRFSPFNRPCKAGASGLYRHWNVMKGRWS
ncbi:MAG: hypothetical protein V1912_02395 [bacterium]